MEYLMYVSLFPLLVSALITTIKPQKVSARHVLLIGIVMAFLLEVASTMFHMGLTLKTSFLVSQPLIIIGMISFFLISLYTPTWSTKIDTFVGISFLVIISFFMILNEEVIELFGLLAVSWGVFILMIRKHSDVRLLLIIYAVLISICFTLGTVYGVATLLGYMLLLGAFPISAWYGHMFTNVSTGVSASMLVIQCIAATKIAPFIPDVAEISHTIMLCLALASSLMAVFQPIALRALSGLAASQLCFIAFCYILPYDGIEDARMFITATFILATPGLLLAVGALEARRGVLTLYRPQGNYDSYPRLANVILLFGLLSAGFPLSLGYVGEDLLFEMGFHHELEITIGWLVVISMNAITVMKLFLYLCQGNAVVERGIDLKYPKYIASCISIGFLFLVTFFI